MGAELRVYRRRIRSVQSTKKITKAMELIAASRIAKAQARIDAARPYAEELTRALVALGRNASIRHPLLTGVERPRRAGVLLVTSDRGLAGGYNANAIKAANRLCERLSAEGKAPVRYVVGRKGVAYYRFRRVPLAGQWTGFSEQPSFVDARAATELVLGALSATSAGEHRGEAGIDELHLVFTSSRTALHQVPGELLIAPVGDLAADPGAGATAAPGGATPAPAGATAAPGAADGPGEAGAAGSGPQPAYEFEPEAEQLLGTLLPRYISARIFSALLDSALAESASRRNAMRSASDNAEELIKTYTRLANEARQAEITQEISEIIGGTDALAAASGSE
ncbi:MAG: F0F1 ATP synthase subunit gamma [Actinomycetia bacterium]|nr:F0F1 ATP synthase subunit gamma [Actinomycetes bacterium]